MKVYIALLFTFLFFSISCNDPKEITLEISENVFNVDNNENNLKVNITCNSEWEVNSSTNWCVPSKKTGTSDNTLTLTVEPNINQTDRSATVTITSEGINKIIQITQKAGSSDIEFHYKIPVIFHVLYFNEKDRFQNVEKGRLAQIIDKCNKMYKDNLKSVDMNLEFVLATTDPNGNTLSEPGVERIKWSTSVLDCDEFMSNNNKKYSPLLWNPDRYINIMLYTFTDKHVLGIAHLPFSLESSYLEGLTQVNFSPSKESLKFPYSVSINNTYIYEETNIYYNPFDVNVTVAHELGHYLGLHHAFYEDNSGNRDSCKDTDYCEDTPSYNRVEYEKWLKTVPESIDFKSLCTRTDCSGQKFLSRNIMDYMYCYSDQFTPDQRKRIRHVLTYSPLIPGPKKGRTNILTRKGVQDLPIRTIK